MLPIHNDRKTDLKAIENKLCKKREKKMTS